MFARIFTLYFFLIVLLRLMGKRQLSEFQPFELAVTMLMADMASVPLTDPNQPLPRFIIPVVILAFLQATVSYITMKNPRLRELICGKAVTIIRKGKIDQASAREMMLSADDFIRILRSAGSPELEKIRYAVAETNGEVNIILTEEEIPLTLIENGRFAKAAEKNQKALKAALDKSHLTEKDIFWGYIRGSEITLIKYSEGKEASP